LKYYYPPFIDDPGESGQARHRPDLSHGFDTFKQHDDKVDEHLDALLETLMQHEQKSGERMPADIVTWRGVITKVGRPAYIISHHGMLRLDEVETDLRSRL